MTNFSVLAIDLAKHSFSFVLLSKQGSIEKKGTVSRVKLIKLFSTLKFDKVAMEACSSAHYWARRLKDNGHTVELLPPQHVKGYLRGQKNDINDALAIAEACQHGKIRSARVLTIKQQDEQAFSRIRELLGAEQTKVVNQIRGLLSEYGIIISKGVASFSRDLPLILEDAENGLTPEFREILFRRYQQFLAIKSELDWYNQKLQQKVKSEKICQKLIAIPAVGPINSFSLFHWLGDGKQFKRGRDAAAALGVVPKQHTTGGKVRLQGISKRGNRRLRASLVHGARAVVTQAIRQLKEDKLSLWLRSLVERRGSNKAVVALVNKVVRIAWVIVAKGETYHPAV